MTKALVILCGGLSTRMGSDKAFLPFGNTSLINYQIERFRPYFSNIYLSVPRQEDAPLTMRHIADVLPSGTIILSSARWEDYSAF
ncbi:MAG: NTP transferase domain-containing protein [Eubacterium sp.]